MWFIFGNQYYQLAQNIPIPQWKKLGGKEVENRRNILKPDILRLYNEKLLILDGNII